MGLPSVSPFTTLNIPSLSIPCTQKLNSFCLNLVMDFKRFFFFVVYFVHHFYVFVVEIWPINKSSFCYVVENFENPLVRNSRESLFLFIFVYLLFFLKLKLYKYLKVLPRSWSSNNRKKSWWQRYR